jgi:hypothetical protein
LSFWQNVESTALGATLGFVFSIALFYLSQKVSRSTWRRDSRKSFSKELEFNRKYIETQLGALDKTIERIANDEREVFPPVRFSGMRTIAYGQFVGSGYIWDDLRPEDVAQLDEMLWNTGPAAEQLVFQAVEAWRQQQADRKTTYQVLEWKRDQLRDYVELLKRLDETLARLIR